MKVSYFENHRLMFILQYAIFAFIWGEHRKLSTRGLVFSPRDDNLMLTSYEHNNCFIIPKKQFFNTLSVGCGCRPGDNLLTPSTLYMLGLFIDLSPTSAIFRERSTLSHPSGAFVFKHVKYGMRMICPINNEKQLFLCD